MAQMSNKMLLNAAECQGYSFYPFWVIKGKPTPPPRLGLNLSSPGKYQPIPYFEDMIVCIKLKVSLESF